MTRFPDSTQLDTAVLRPSKIIQASPAWFDGEGFLSQGFADLQELLNLHGPELFPLYGHYEYRASGASEERPIDPSRRLILPFSVECRTDDHPSLEVHQTLPGNSVQHEKAVIERDALALHRGVHVYRRFAAFRDHCGRPIWVETGRSAWIDHPVLRTPPQSSPNTCGVIYRYLYTRLFNAARGTKLLHHTGATNPFQLEAEWNRQYAEEYFFGMAKSDNPRGQQPPTRRELALFDSVRSRRHLDLAAVEDTLAQVLATARVRTDLSQ